MKIGVDTNVLVRVAVQDDTAQAAMAQKVMDEADEIAVSLVCLCEFVWVLRRLYKSPVTDVALAIRTLLAAENVRTNRLAVEAGLSVLEGGGDFADGVIAYDSAWIGGEVFVTFDRDAGARISEGGVAVRVLA